MRVSHSVQPAVPDAVESNKRVIRRLFDEVFNQGNLQVVEELWIPGRLEEGKQSTIDLRSAFPDYHRTIEAQIAEGDLVATRWTARGTHRGPFRSRVLGRSIAPTGRGIQTPGVSVHRVIDGRVVEAWVLGNDSVELLAQLGAVTRA